MLYEIAFSVQDLKNLIGVLILILMEYALRGVEDVQHRYDEVKS